MSNNPIPITWLRTEIGEIANLQTGKTPETSNPKNYENQDIIFIKPGDLDIDSEITIAETSVSINAAQAIGILPTGTILISCIGNLGKVGILGKKGICNQQINAILPNTWLDEKFVFYWAKTIKEWMYQNSSATTVTILNKGRFSKAPFPLPPLNEQRRIVAKLEQLQGRIKRAREALEQVPAKLEQLKQSVLAAAFRGDLTAQWRAEHPDVEPASVLIERNIDFSEKDLDHVSDKTLRNLPIGWQWVKIRNLSEDNKNSICAGPFGTIFKAKDFKNQGIPIIFLRHVLPEKYITKKPGFMDKAVWENLFKDYSVYGGELLITKLGDPPGVCAIYPKNIGPAMVTPDVIKMNVNEKIALPEYLMFYLNSTEARQLAFGVAYGATRPRMNLSIFRDILVPLAPLEEQTKIISEIKSKYYSISSCKKNIKKMALNISTLDSSILAKAFRGELVEQDPTDEPASVLLERIRAEREANGEQKKAGRGRKKKEPAQAPQGDPATPTASTLQIPTPKAVMTDERPPKVENAVQRALFAEHDTPDSAAQVILEALRKRGVPTGKADLVDTLKLTDTQWNQAIQGLLAQGAVVREGQKRGAKYRLA